MGTFVLYGLPALPMWSPAVLVHSISPADCLQISAQMSLPRGCQLTLKDQFRFPSYILLWYRIPVLFSEHLTYFIYIVIIWCLSLVAQTGIPACNAGEPGFNPWVGKIPWRRKWQPTSTVLLPGKSRGQRSLVGYRSWGRKELDMSDFTYLAFQMSAPQGRLWSSVPQFQVPGTVLYTW